MARRPRSNSNQDNTNLSKEQVYQVLEFADKIYNPAYYQNEFGLYNPYTLNQNLKELNNDAKVPTYEKILKAFETIQDSEDILQSYSEWMKWTEAVYAKTLNYFSNILSFDLRYNCKNAEKSSNYQSKEYKQDIKIVHKWLDSFDYKRYFKQMVDEMLKSNIVYTWLRDNNSEEYPQRALQILPQKHCIITGNSSVCPLFDFNMGYFLNPSTSLDLYPEVFKDYYNEVFKSEGYDKYYPSNPFSKRDGTYSYFHQTSVKDGAFCFIFNDGNFNNVPPFAYLLRSTILNPEIEELQRNKDIASAYALLVGELRIFDGAKSGEKPNQWAISPEMVGAFLSKVQSGLRKNVRPVAMPTEETKYMQFVDSSPLMSTYKYSESAAQGASASTLIYSASKPNQEELRVMVQTDYNLMKNLYYQFNSFMNYFINKKTRKYKFNFEFTGMNYTFYRKEQADLAMKFADKGFVFNSSYYASILGLKPQEFDRMLAEGHSGDMINNLSMLINMNTMSSSGRPQKDSNDLSQSGNVSQEYGNYDKGL